MQPRHRRATLSGAAPPLRLAAQLLFATGTVALLTIILLATGAAQRLPTVSLLYVLAVVGIAATCGRLPALLGALLASLAYNYAILAPVGTIRITTVEDGIRLVTFVSVALLVGGIAGHARSQADAANRRAARLDALYSLSQTISLEVSLERIAQLVAQTTVDLLGVGGCKVLITTGPTPRECASVGSLGYAIEESVVPTEGPPVVALQVARRQVDLPLSPPDRALLDTIAAQMAGAVERARLAETSAHMRALAESDRLKSALLSSVSHDLRTPLAVIKGSVTNLLDEAVAWDDEARTDLLSSINEETDRLNRLVGDLLEMTRIEAGALHQIRDWQDLGEIIGAVTTRLRPRLAHHRLIAVLPPELPPIRVSYVQIDQILTNLIENASQYAPHGSAIELHARCVTADKHQTTSNHPHDQTTFSAQHSALGDWLLVEVLDRGPGVEPGLRERIFEKFVRAEEPERSARGSGLGLAICKGLVEAHGGRIWVEDRPGGGARFVFTLPLQPEMELGQSHDTVSAYPYSGR